MDVLAILALIVSIAGLIKKSSDRNSDRPGQSHDQAKQASNDVDGDASRAITRATDAVTTVPPVAKASTPFDDISDLHGVWDMISSIGSELMSGGDAQVPENNSTMMSMSDPNQMWEGRSTQEDEMGCIGGSLPHDETSLHEGEGQWMRGRNTVMVPSITVAKQMPKVQTQVQTQYRITAEEMRKAVVMSEILGKPKALQRRNKII